MARPAGHYWCFLSRVIEKTTEYACCILDKLMEKLMQEQLLEECDCSALMLLGDAGGHFRSRAMLGRCAKEWPEKTGCNVHLIIGPEQHMKGRIDGEFGCEQRLLTCATHAGKWVWDIDELVEVLDKAHIADPDPFGCKWTFLDYMPEMEKADFKKTLTYIRPTSLPVPLRSTHHWSFTINDHRRWAKSGSVCGVGRRVGELTNITARAHVLPGLRCVAERTVDGRPFCLFDLP